MATITQIALPSHLSGRSVITVPVQNVGVAVPTPLHITHLGPDLEHLPKSANAVTEQRIKLLLPAAPLPASFRKDAQEITELLEAASPLLPGSTGIDLGKDMELVGLVLGIAKASDNWQANHHHVDAKLILGAIPTLIDGVRKLAQTLDISGVSEGAEFAGLCVKTARGLYAICTGPVDDATRQSFLLVSALEKADQRAS